MEKQTPVEWLVNKIYMLIPNEERNFLEGLKEQANEIFKEQIINFGNDLLAQNDRSYIQFPDLAEQYYNETYNK